mgnify:FL=1
MRSTGNSPLFFTAFHATGFFDFTDAFEARGVDKVKKETSKIREDKIR